MFKFETDVAKQMITLVVAICLSAPVYSFAADDDDSSSGKKSDVDCVAEAKEDVNYRVSQGELKTAKERLKAYEAAKVQCYGGGSLTGCAKDQKELNEAKSKLGTACAKAQMSSRGKAGSIACSDAIKKCEQRDEVQSGLDEDSTVSYDTEALREQLNYCPAMGAQGLKEMKEELKSAREDLDKYDEDLAELEEQASEKGNSGQEAILEKQGQMQEAARSCRDAKKDLERKLKDGEKAVYDQVQQLYTQQLELNNQIAAAERSKNEAAAAYNNEVTNLDLQCYAMAINKVNEKRKAVLAKVSASRYNLGGMGNVLGSFGKSSRQKDQEEAKREYNFCRGGADYAMKRKQLATNQALAEKAADSQKVSLQAQLAQTQQQIGVLQNNETARMRTEVWQDMNDVNTDCINQQNLLSQQLQAAQMNAMNLNGALQKRMGELTNKKKLAEDSYTNVRDAVRIKNAAGGGGSSSSEDFFAAFAALADYEGKAQSFKLTCCGDLKEMAGTCNEIARYIDASGLTTAATSVGDTTPDVPESNVADIAQTDREQAHEKKNPKAKTTRTPTSKPVVLPSGKKAPIPTLHRKTTPNFKPSPAQR